ncbi:hypothetical protein BG621_00455 [Parasaccharibacter apium]|nr:hypothetical protein BG621_00455 [Parasaccharibacter apium]
MGGATALLCGVMLCLFYWHYQSGALWRIVQHCAVDAAHRPCTIYKAKDGYAVLKAREGQGQYLLLPTQPIRGIEADPLLHADTPPYVQQAWEQRHFVAYAYGIPIADERFLLAINSRWARSQEQLHIHIDCMREDVRQILAHIPREARAGEVRLLGHMYRWWRVPTLEPPALQMVSFFPKGADERERGRYGVAVIASQGAFLLLRNRAGGMGWGYAEELQDHQCRP